MQQPWTDDLTGVHRNGESAGPGVVGKMRVAATGANDVITVAFECSDEFLGGEPWQAAQAATSTATL